MKHQQPFGVAVVVYCHRLGPTCQTRHYGLRQCTPSGHKTETERAQHRGNLAGTFGCPGKRTRQALGSGPYINAPDIRRHLLSTSTNFNISGIPYTDIPIMTYTPYPKLKLPLPNRLPQTPTFYYQTVQPSDKLTSPFFTLTL